MNGFKKVLCILLIAALLVVAAGCVQFDDTSTDDDHSEQVDETLDQIIEDDQNELLSQKENRMSLVNSAIELIDEKGELAFDDFREKDSPWYHNDSYITVWNTEGIRIVFPPKVSGEGESVLDLEDYNGEPLGRMFIDTALSEEGEGWVNYYWPRPGETTPSKKSAFVKRTSIGNQTYLVHSGLYVDDYVYSNILEDGSDEHFVRFGDVSLGNVLHPAMVDRDLDVDYSIAHVMIKPGGSIELHLMKNPEVYYVLAGEGMLYIEDVPFELSEGQLVLIPANSKQHTENTGDVDLEFLAIDQPAWAAENEVIFE
ncbi:cache domain-containing protein [Methanolobus sp. ZRKC5]|uniref:cache domain-containing protein n=1 Tax=unclassified Methanolobus TaxID=2629569 RepID=UPI00313D067D